MDTKLCNGCDLLLTIDNYTVTCKTKGYLRRLCKPCRAEKLKLKRKSDPLPHKLAARKYYKKHKKEINKKLWEYRKNNPMERLRCNIRKRLHKVLKTKRLSKNNKLNDYIGCTKDELIYHIEKQFQPGMSWDNYGEWHLDHIKPLSLGNTSHEIESLNHFENLQPLWAYDNIKKSNFYPLVTEV